MCDIFFLSSATYLRRAVCKARTVKGGATIQLIAALILCFAELIFVYLQMYITERLTVSIPFGRPPVFIVREVVL